MRFDKATILSFDDEQLSPAEKKLLVEKFFPKAPAPWQEKLAKHWPDLKRRQWDQKRWQQYLSSGGVKNGVPYRCTHEWLLKAAKQRSPTKIGNRVTDFSGWVFSLYRPQRNAESLFNGQRVERVIAARLVPVSCAKEWDLIYEDPLTEKRQVKSISSLTIQGRPLMGCPDLVFREKATGRILIVERKVSNKEIPSDGWPNLRAQLWAYAQIDEWLKAPQIFLIGEIWGFTNVSMPFLRRVIRWVHGEQRFEQNNAQLFDLYRDPRA